VVVPTAYGVDLLAASSGSQEMVSLGQARMGMFINELISFAANYDVLLFDCAAGIDSSVTSFISATPQSIIVATPQPTSILDVYALMKLIYQQNLTDNISLIVNMANSDGQGKKVAETLNQVSKGHLSKSIELLGIIPNSGNVEKAIRSRKPLLSTSGGDIAAKRVKEISRIILQKQNSLTEVGQIDAEKLLDGLLKI